MRVMCPPRNRPSSTWLKPCRRSPPWRARTAPGRRERRVGAVVQVRQPAREQARHGAADGMRVQQHARRRAARAAGRVRRAAHRDRAASRQPRAPRSPSGPGGRPDRAARRQRSRWGTAGFRLARVEQSRLRRAVEVHHGARNACQQHRRSELGREVVEPVHVPIGIGHLAPDRCQTRSDGRRHEGAGMRNADHQRRLPRAQGESAGCRRHQRQPAPGRRRPPRPAPSPPRYRGRRTGPPYRPARARAAWRWPPAAGRWSHRRVEADALGRGQQLDADDGGRVVAHVVQAPGGEGGHRDVVLLVGRGRQAVHAGGMGQRLVLAGQRRGGDLGDHEAGIDAGIGDQEGGQAAHRRVGQQRRAPFGQCAPISAIASASVSAAIATGSAWKLPPDSTSPDRRTPAGCRWRHWPRCSARLPRGAWCRGRRPSPAAGSAGCRGPAPGRNRGGEWRMSLPSSRRAVGCGDVDLPGLAARRMDARIERRVAALRRIDGQRAGDDGGGEQASPRGTGRTAPARSRPGCRSAAPAPPSAPRASGVRPAAPCVLGAACACRSDARRPRRSGPPRDAPGGRGRQRRRPSPWRGCRAGSRLRRKASSCSITAGRTPERPRARPTTFSAMISRTIGPGSSGAHAGRVGQHQAALQLGQPLGAGWRSAPAGRSRC